jgi:hypothetical protein
MTTLKVGDQVIANGKPGTVKYVGAPDQRGTWIGVELDAPHGSHDGKGLFKCRAKHGLLCRPCHVFPVGVVAATTLVPQPSAEPVFVQEPPPAKKKHTETSEDIFEAYALLGEPSPQQSDSIGPEGIMRLCADMGTAPESLTTLLMAWQMRMVSSTAITRPEFVGTMNRLGCRSVADLRARLDRLATTLAANDTLFRELFAFAFEFAKESPEHKVVDVKTAAAMLQLVLTASPRYTRHAEAFIRFLSSDLSSQHVLNRDQWLCFLDFSCTVPDDFVPYDPCSAWPVIFDDFVSLAKLQQQPQEQDQHSWHAPR